MKWKVVLSDIDLSATEIKAVQKVLKSRWLSMGEVTSQFEKSFAATLGAKHALAVSNGTAALHLALMACGVRPGDEVIVPSFTFVASVNSILYCGAAPVFVDIKGPEDLNVSLKDLQAKITSKTRAVVVLHYAGYPVDLPALLEVVREAEARFNRKIWVIEDAAHAPGAKVSGKFCGAWGDAGCFSFFANKNLVTGEGGMVVTESDQLATALKTLRSHGMTSLSWDRHQGHAHSYDVVELGYNYRLTEIEAALGREQLKKLKKSNAKRKKLTLLYRKILSKLPDLTLPFAKPNGEPAYHIFPILLPEKKSRTAFIDHLKSAGIQTSIHYPPVHQFSFYRARFSNVFLPQTEQVARREVTLPLHPLMKERDVRLVCRAVEKALKKS